MENKPVAIVTGASRGIGKAIAEVLASKGFLVYITYVSKASEAENVVAEIAKKGFHAKAFQLNVADSEAVVRFFQDEIKDKVRLEVLVNNAGITKDGLLLRMKDDDFDSVINTNLKGSFLCMRESSKIMSKQRYGRIINISSVVGEMGNAGQVNYAASKAGMIGMTKSAAKELAPRNITVNAVTPGFIETDMTNELPESVKEFYIKAIPLGKLGNVLDIAHAVAFLASMEAEYITGQVLGINGGMHC